MTELIDLLLEQALDIQISEFDFWEMTIEEINRRIESYNRTHKEQMREKAYFDYQLAELIGISVARVFDAEIKMPETYKVYPSLFEEPKEEQPKPDVSMMRFLQYATNHNLKYKIRGEN